MIEKLLPRVLNSSSDNRLKKKTEMNDALNIVVTEDFEDYDSSDDTGNEGVIKPVKGNTAQTRVPDGLARILGVLSAAFLTPARGWFTFLCTPPTCKSTGFMPTILKITLEKE